MSEEKCNVCGKKDKDDRFYICENCGLGHCPECSGDNYEGSGEYPDEDAYSVCQVCINKNK